MKNLCVAISLVTALVGGMFYDQPLTPEAAVQQERARFGERPTLAQVGEIINNAAARFPYLRLLRKETGTFCPSPAGSIACDIFIDTRNGHHYDVLGDADGAAIPIPFVDKGPCQVGPTSQCSLSNAVVPVLGTVPAPQPPSTPPTAPPTDPSVIEALRDIQARLRAIQEQPCRLTDSQYQNLLRLLMVSRPVTLRVPMFGGTATGTVGGVQ